MVRPFRFLSVLLAVILLTWIAPSLFATQPANNQDSNTAKDHLGKSRPGSSSRWSWSDDYDWDDDDDDEWFLSPLEVLANEPYPGESRRPKKKPSKPATAKGWRDLAKEHKKAAQKYLEKSYDKTEEAEKLREKSKKRTKWAEKAEKEKRPDQYKYEHQAKKYGLQADLAEKDSKFFKKLSKMSKDSAKHCEEKAKELEKKEAKKEEVDD